MGDTYKDRINKLFEFRKIPGYLAEANKFGEIRGLKFKKLYSQYETNGYNRVGIKSENGCWKQRFVHILVARAFLGKCPKGHEVNHIDLDKANSYWRNLEYLTRKENRDHAIRNGHNTKGKKNGMYGKNRSGEKGGYVKLTWHIVKKIRKLRKQGNTLQSIGDKCNVTKQTIYLIVNNKTWIER